MGAFEGIADFVADFKALKAKVADLAVVISPEATHFVGAAGEPGFQHSWVNFDSDRPAAYYRHMGRVHLAGVVKSGTVGSSAFTLLAGYRPASVNGLIFAVTSNGVFGVVTVDSTGAVIPAIGSNTYFALDGISFRHT